MSSCTGPFGPRSCGPQICLACLEALKVEWARKDIVNYPVFDISKFEGEQLMKEYKKQKISEQVALF